MTTEPKTVENQEKTEYNLLGSAMLHAPGFLRYLIAMHATDPGNAYNILCNTWPSLPGVIVAGLLRGEIEYSGDDTGMSAVLQLTPEQHAALPPAEPRCIGMTLRNDQHATDVERINEAQSALGFAVEVLDDLVHGNQAHMDDDYSDKLAEALSDAEILEGALADLATDREQATD